MRILKMALAWTIIFCFASMSFARDITHIDSALNSAKLQGSGKLTWWGFHIYDASFYRSANPASSEFALDIRYHKSFSGVSIANRSVEEMKKIGVPEAQASLWGKELANFLPDIESGQTLTAVYNPPQGTLFYHDGKRIAQVPGADFSKAFFGIWLDPKTSAPKLRKDLLGQSCSPPIFNEAC
ncbi:chalcone isomerase family protein [Polynucleobacter sp. MWH-Creno-3A4]|uniref:chalcone isomerase family protein n=1 Tax=Polynucleobacter sp. MWH-Creno-3A4 TaxID=1855886 RepID=UPI001C0B8AAD|nr:chalcone isomerase family protein [Polynucleobacter sp. MWH-Creno-3A4]MBU3605436.1 chalcone isomerase family protein [Polynucleobacter sp. MWH-Creno-3A4]